MDKTNIFNIPANYDFFQSLFSWLEKQYPQQLSEVKIFLPNRRSCRQFRQVLLEKKLDIILPKIKAISDISYEDFFNFLPNENAKTAIDEILQYKVLDGIDYLFFLTQEIQKLSVFGDNLDFNQAFKIAGRLQDLFDEIERDEIDLKKLEEIDDSDLSKHRQLTLDFLKNFHVQIKNSLLKQKVFFASNSQNFIISKFVKLLETQASKTPIVIAGSTGSVSFSKKLIKAISLQKNGHVILHSALKNHEVAENHPQFFLNQLIKFLEVDEIKNIAEEKFQLSAEIRQNLLSLMTLASEETIKWQKISQFLDVKKAANDLEKNFKIVEAKNEIEEAKIISLILRDAAKQNKNAAIVTNNDRLVELLKPQLEMMNLSFNDTRNLGIFNSKLINFLLLILELFESDFDSHILLSILKNPLCIFSNEKEILTNFEINILRQERLKSGLEGIREKLKSDKKLQNLFNEFYGNLKPLEGNLPKIISQLILTAENLSKKPWLKLLESESAQIEIFEFFEKLKTQNIELDQKNLFATFKNLFAQISFFEKSDATAPIQILSTVEARLLNFDLMIIASLNEGDFPQIEVENWLGKKIKKDLGIDKTAKKIGQNAYDFCNYLSNKSVVMSRSKSRNGAVLIESAFLLKFKTICKKIGANLQNGEEYFLELKMLNSAPTLKIKAPDPKPKIEFRPQKISITEISKLLTNPYAIYAKKILKLKELQKIDFEPSYAEFGSFIHKALEEFVKNPQIKNFSEIFEKYFISKEAKLVWFPKFEKIFSDFISENEKFLKNKTFTEIPVKLQLEKVLISGKIDRVILDEENNLEIFDYKTGQPPSKKSVFAGKEPQLTLAALILIYGTIESELKNVDLSQIKSLNYWKLSSSSISKITQISKKNEEIQILLAAAKSGLEKLFEFFSDEENGYIATAIEDKFNEYEHLMRVEEWNK
jgi:ATP-dependent helicase/nuclease subunit B